MIDSAMERMQRWLDSARNDDPLYRRHARAMQLLLLFVAVMLPANWLYHYAVVGLPGLRGRDVLMAADMATASAALIGFVLVRMGKLRLAVLTYLSVLVAGIAASAVAIGFHLLMFDQTHMLLCLVIGGLVLGRRALWCSLAALLLAFVAGMATDAMRLAAAGRAPGAAFANVPSVLLSYLVITMVIDRCVHALRTALKESEARGAQLATEIAQRERAQAHLIHAQKMEVVGRVAGGIAHDFENILNVILGYASASERLAGKGLHALLDAMHGIEQATRRAMKISRRLLAFSRNDEGQPERFDACQAVRDGAPMLRQLCGPQVRVELDCTGTLPICMDPTRFELALLNLASNAHDAMPTGGRLSIAVHEDAATGHAVVVLQDDGVGMSPAVLERIFDPFYTTKPSSRGTGLGLDVVNRVVREAGGTIQVSSVPGRGSCFSLRIPLAREPACDSRPDAPSS